MLGVFVVIYLLLTVAIGIAASRYIKTSTDFMLAGRKLPMFLSASALFALWFGSETIFGASSEFVKHGVLGVIEDPFGGVLCLVLFALIFVKPLYRLNLLTLGDLYRNHYGKSVELIASFCMLLTFFGYIAAQLVALGILIQIISGLPTIYGILISASVVTIYTLMGGMWAITITDFMQSIIIVVGLVIVAVTIVNKAGGMAPVLNGAPEGFFSFVPTDGDPMTWIHYLAAWLTLGLGSLASQDIFQRANSAESEKTAVRSTLLGAGMYGLIAILPLFIGLAGKVLYPELIDGDTQQVLPSMVMAHTNLWVQVMFFGALLSAIFSTCSGAVLAPASILSENIIRPLVDQNMSDKRFLVILRVSVVGMAALAAWLAAFRTNIYELVSESSILGLVTLFVPMVTALFWKKSSRGGAILSMVVGLISWFLSEHVFHFEFPAMFIGFGTSALGMVVGTLMFPRDR
ncbi:sodium:solute symporter family protein [uncultured Imperialibacter sp.]|uniref:sodium:solute symporter family protein n=1 Tax=uncultured Imperialibacter sp. TaxID=1672639 RepID=UPI0030D6FC60|tara:strand:- start:1642 stop:3024 length:1383 start_codon:yes stop_codon:yes gene_type:complete